MKEGTKYLDIVTAVFASIAIISGVTAGKIFAIGDFTLPGSALIFPVTYIFGDILTEVYGFRRSRRVIWIGLFCSMTASIVFGVVAVLPPAETFDADEAFRRVLGQVPRIAVAGWLGFFFGEMSNSIILSIMKKWTKGRWLWTRTIGSTLVGEFVDTAIFFTGAFIGVLDSGLIFKTIVTLYLWKVAVEVIFTPATYFVVRKLKERENTDVFDYGETYNPFRFRL